MEQCEERREMDSRKLELIKKLRALAERGVGGEKEGARKKLEELMAKYDIDEADLHDDDKEDFYPFSFNSKQERILLFQVFYSHFDDYTERTYKMRRGAGSRKTILFKCTKLKAIEIGIEYDFYRELWEEEATLFLSAFIQKHEIFSMNPAEISESPRSKAEEVRMYAMMAGLQDKSPQRRLEG